MYPFGWSAGEPTRPDVSFARFQSFSDEARAYAAKRYEGKDYNMIFDELQREFTAANDNRSEIGDEAVAIMLHTDFMSMVRCWLACGRDMVLTKLAYEDGWDD